MQAQNLSGVLEGRFIALSSSRHRKGICSVKDTCKNKTAPYDIRISDKPLIDAAMCLGERLATRPETTTAQQSAIACMLSFLDRLPSPPEPGLNVEFSVTIRPNDYDQPNAIVHVWFVSVCRGGFEIGSIYTPYPGDDRRRDPISESEHELSWELCPGEHNCNDSLSKRSEFPLASGCIYA